MLNEQYNESEPESLLIRRAITLGLSILTLAEKLHLPVSKPNRLMSWLEESLQKAKKEEKATKFIKLLAKGDKPSNADVALLADELNIDVRILTLIRDSVVKNIKDNAKQREESGNAQNEYIGDP
ncbi:MAG: hypothetical protein KME55_42040 [Nostoc indistinguendum CM1-VF10]|jgi:hypothetical protein|nr:hypothetical protein [Nostoc indistinguendum CM1-VF10]